MSRRRYQSDYIIVHRSMLLFYPKIVMCPLLAVGAQGELCRVPIMMQEPARQVERKAIFSFRHSIHHTLLNFDLLVRMSALRRLHIWNTYFCVCSICHACEILLYAIAIWAPNII